MGAESVFGPREVSLDDMALGAEGGNVLEEEGPSGRRLSPDWIYMISKRIDKEIPNILFQMNDHHSRYARSAVCQTHEAGHDSPFLQAFDFDHPGDHLYENCVSNFGPAITSIQQLVHE